MALQSVKFTLNGQTYDLTLDGATGAVQGHHHGPGRIQLGRG